MGFLKDAISKATKAIDKAFDSDLAAKYRQIDPIARLVGEEYQRHILHVAASTLLGPPGSPIGSNATLMDYYSARNRGADVKTARRHVYQNQLKSTAILATIFGIGYAGGAFGGGEASGVSGAASSAPSTTGVAAGSWTEAATAEAGAAEIAGGAGSAGTFGAGAGETSAFGATAAAAPAGPASAPAVESASALSKAGTFVKENPLLAYGALQLGGGLLEGAMTPSRGEEEADVLRARQEANRFSGSVGGSQRVQVSGYRAPTRQGASTVNVLTPEQLLAASRTFRGGLLSPSGG